MDSAFFSSSAFLRALISLSISRGGSIVCHACVCVGLWGGGGGGGGSVVSACM